MCTESPEKMQFRSLRAAALHALEQLETYGRLQRAYRCDCGDYHVTSKGYDGNPIAEEMVRALAAAA